MQSFEDEYTQEDHERGQLTQYERVTLNEEVETLLGFAAGDYYEGWSSYWEDQEYYERKMMEWLVQWKALCVSKSSE